MENQPQQPNFNQQSLPPEQIAQYSTPQPNNSTTTQSKTDVLGIIAIVMAFIGLSLIGLIVGIVGIFQANKHNHSKVLSVIAVVINIVITLIVAIVMLVVFLSVPALQRASRDVERSNDVSMLISQINDIYTMNGTLPVDCTEIQAALEKISSANTAVITSPTAPEGAMSCSTQVPNQDNDVYQYTVKSAKAGEYTISYWSETEKQVKTVSYQ